MSLFAEISLLSCGKLEVEERRKQVFFPPISHYIQAWLSEKGILGLKGGERGIDFRPRQK